MAGELLVIVAGTAAGRRIPLGAELLIGKAAPDDGRLGGDPDIARWHARISRAGDDLVIEDLDSAGGTYVNGTILTAARVLRNGDVIKLGRTTLELHGSAGDERLPDPVEQVGSVSSIHGVQEIGRASPVPAEIVYAGKRVSVPGGGLGIGRLSDNEVAIPGDQVSRHHARIATSEGRYFIGDLNTVNGTYLNGERLRGESRWLNPGDTITIGGESLRFLTGQRTQVGHVSTPIRGMRTVRFDGRRLTLGRDPSNDVGLDDPNVSRFHAEVVAGRHGPELRDLGSRNGTRLDGRPVEHGLLGTGSEVGIGPFRLLFDGTSFLQRDDRGALRLDSEDLVVAVKERTILNRCTLSIQPGEFAAIIGESGSGKTTLIRALAGVTTPTAGNVTVSGEPVRTRLTDIGYVPQDEIVHRHLTVLEALNYSARLRLPRDSSEADVNEAVQRVLHDVSLEEHAATRIGSLSGGQRKRAGVATELLTRPSLLFLDEPTTGLDPGLETRMMALFRELAEPGMRSVTLVTHATKNLGMVDKICVMGRGGELSFFGPPAEAKEFFGTDSYDGIYSALDERPAQEWRREFEDRSRFAPDDARASTPAHPVSLPRSKRSRTGAQAGILGLRYLKLTLRDRRNMLILLGQVPVIGLATAFLFKSNVLAEPGQGRPADAAQLLFLLATTSIWLGSIDGSREIIKEKALMEREAAVGVRPSAYLFSKVLILSALAILQVALLVGIILLLRPLSESFSTHLTLVGILVLTAFVAVGLGLLTSALVNTEDQATSFIPLLLIPQLLFAGAIVAVKDMSGPISALSNAIFARWSFSSAGTAIDMNERIAGDPEFQRVDRYGSSFFDLAPGLGAAILVGFMILLFGCVLLALRQVRR